MTRNGYAQIVKKKKRKKENRKVTDMKELVNTTYKKDVDTEASADILTAYRQKRQTNANNSKKTDVDLGGTAETHTKEMKRQERTQTK